MSQTKVLKAKVVADSSQDPASLGRVQIYIPTLHRQFDTNKVGPSSSSEDSKYPWANYVINNTSSNGIDGSQNNSMPNGGILSGILSNLTKTLTSPTGSISTGFIDAPKVGSIVLVSFENADYTSPLIIGVLGGSYTSTAIDGNYAGGSLAEIAAQIIFGNEGGYTTVAWNDHNCLARPMNMTSSCTCGNSASGSLSIGKIQWHANRARELMKEIRDADPNGFDSICSKHRVSFNFNDNWGTYRYWNSYCPSGAAIKEILGTDASKKTQDEKAVREVAGYIETAKSGGISDPGCLIYLADIINQYGSCPKLVKSGINNLDELYNYSLNNGYSTYKTRRQNTYNKIKELQAQGAFVENGLILDGGNTGGQILWPAPGISTITSPWGPRTGLGGTWHNGIDIGTPLNTNIIASATGIVSVAQFNSGGYGWYVVIKHPQLNIRTLYAHGTQLLVSAGQQVQAGQVILKSGNTGNSTGPHLHYTVATGLEDGTIGMGSSQGHKNDVNPLNWVKAP